jgi:hypothetical protein
MDSARNLNELSLDPIFLEELEHLFGVLDRVCDICSAMEELYGAFNLADSLWCLGLPLRKEIDSGDAVLVKPRWTPVLQRAWDGSGGKAIQARLI